MSDDRMQRGETHAIAAFERHLGRSLCAGERAAFREGHQATAGLGGAPPCPYRNELAVAWRAGLTARRAAVLRMEPAWP